MTTLLIIGASIVYVLAALQVSRHVLGHWTYNEWVRKRRYCDAFEDYTHSDEAFVGTTAFILSLTLLPVMAYYGVFAGRPGGWVIAPKHHRETQKIARQAERIRELEAAAGIPSDGSAMG